MTYQAGLGTRTITPRERDVKAKKIYVWGYAYREGPTTWPPRDEIWSRALALSDGTGSSVVLVSLDLCALSRELVEAVRRSVSTLIPPEHVLINVTHTHRGPVTVEIPTYKPGLAQPYPPYMAFLLEQVVGSIEEAVANLRPATLRFNRGQTAIGKNRNFKDGAYDTNLDVLQAVEAGTDKTIAVAFFHGCHPPGHANEISSDYPGVARELIEEDSRVGKRKALFFQGFGGTIEPRTTSRPGEVGCEVRVLLKSMTELKGPIAVRRSVIEIPFQPIGREALEKASNPNDPDIKQGWAASQIPDLNRWANSLLAKGNDVPRTLPVELQYIRVGEAPDDWHLLASSHEVVAELAAPVRAIDPLKRLTLAGYSNGQIAYLPSRHVMACPVSWFPFHAKNYDGGHSFVYYGHRAPVVETAEELFLEAITRLLNPGWEAIGDAPEGVVALAEAHATDLKKDMLFAATKAGKLWWREPIGSGGVWKRIGHANDVAGMAGSGDKLYVAMCNGILTKREANGHDLDWAEIGGACPTAAMTAWNGELFAATWDNQLRWRKADGTGVAWTSIGHANHVRGLAALDGKLFNATQDGRLWRRAPVKNDVFWEPFAQAHQVVAMTGTQGRLFAVTVDGKLWWRKP